MCFEDVYLKVKKHCNKNTIILDFGCAYASQSWWFKDCKKYIGIDLLMLDDIRFKTNNSEFYIMSGQRFMNEILPTLNLDFDNVIAICSYVPDVELQNLVANTFKYNYVQYGNEIISNKLPAVS